VTTDYTWDALNRLVEVDDGTNLWSAPQIANHDQSQVLQETAVD
jgi:hypothetical protein